MTDDEALNQIAVVLTEWTTNPVNNPVEEVLATILSNVQETGRMPTKPELVGALTVRPSSQQSDRQTENYREALLTIAQYHPDWTGQHVNNAPSRMQLIDIAYQTLIHNAAREKR